MKVKMSGKMMIKIVQPQQNYCDNKSGKMGVEKGWENKDDKWSEKMWQNNMIKRGGKME